MLKVLFIALSLSIPMLTSTDMTDMTDFSKTELLGQIDYATAKEFSLIPNTYTAKQGIYLRTEALECFEKMAQAAKEEGVNLTIISAARNFEYQKGIWERKWKDGKYIKHFGADRAKAIMRYSSMPGTSRHHWGTDIDINDLNDSYFTNTSEGEKVYEWLKNNAGTYGFHQTYTSKDSGRTGYEEEKWHWSYMPIAKELLKAYNAKISYTDISNFNGAESAEPLGVIELYVNGIDGELLLFKEEK